MLITGILNSTGQDKIWSPAPAVVFRDSVTALLEANIAGYLKNQDPKKLDQIFQLVSIRYAAEIRHAFMQADHNGFGKVPDSLLLLERKFESTLADINIRLSKMTEQYGEDLSESVLLKKQKHDVEMSLLKLKRIFELYYPDYYTIKYGQRIYQLDRIMKKLEPGETMLQYIAVNNYYYLMLIRHHKAGLSRIGKCGDINHLIGSFLPLIRNFQPAVKRVDAAIEFNKWAYPLYNLLIGPVKKSINNSKIIIIPGDSLCYLPFGVLVSDPAELDFREMRMLFRDHPISYSYSPELWAEAAVYKPQFVKGNLISFINDQEDQAKVQMINGAQIFHNKSKSRQEIRELLSIIQGRYFDRKHATEKWFRQRAPDYRIIHIGLPSDIDTDTPLQSKIRFNKEANDTVNDGRLLAWELAGLNLYARLMVLRNCQLHHSQKNQNPYLTPWQFSILNSGIPSVMLSLWPAHHNMSAEFIKGFYAALSNGKTKDEALQEAMLKYLSGVNDVYAHPAFWSGFMITGNTSPLDKPARPWYLYLLILIPVAFVVVWIMVGRKYIQIAG